MSLFSMYRSLKVKVVTKYELYSMVDMKGNETNVMQLNEPMTEEEIEDVCQKYGIDIVKNENGEII